MVIRDDYGLVEGGISIRILKVSIIGRLNEYDVGVTVRVL